MAHQAAELGARLDERHRVAHAAELEGGRQARRPAADDRDALAALLGGRRTPSPARSPGRRRRARACRSRSARRSRGGCRRSRRDGGRCGRRSRGTGCAVPASATRRASPLARERDPLRDVAVDRAGLVAGRGRADVARQRGAPGAGADRLGRAGGPDRTAAARSCRAPRPAAHRLPVARLAGGNVLIVQLGRALAQRALQRASAGEPIARAKAPSSAELTMRPSPARREIASASTGMTW